MPPTRSENPLLTPVLDQVGTLVDWTHVSIYVLDGEDITLLAYRGPVPFREASHFSFPLARAGGARRVITGRAPLLIADAKGDSDVARSFLEATLDVPRQTFDYIGSWMGLPLTIGGSVAGMLDLAHAERNRYTEEDLERVSVYVRNVAAQIENAVHFSDLSQRSLELQTLYEVQQAINRHLELSHILQLVADQALQLTSAGEALIFLVQDDDLALACRSGSALSELPPGLVLPVQGSMIGRALQSGRAWRAFNAQSDPAGDGDVCRLLGARSLLVVPLGPPSDPVGALVAANKVFGAFGPRDERVLSQLAGAAAIAVERSRLVKQAAELVRLQERQRIAETLHDTVAQKLFRIGIEAEWCQQKAPAGEEVAQRIETVRRLVARAGYDLRSAIFALRGTAHAGESSLVALLRSHLSEFQAESGIRALLIASPDLAPLPPATSELLFRIAREALINARKHSRAGTVIVSLRCDDETLTLTIQDDGTGLDEAGAVDPAAGGLHFGISTMRQLAVQLGGRFSIGNNDEHGTIVQVQIPGAGQGVPDRLYPTGAKLQ